MKRFVPIVLLLCALAGCKSYSGTSAGSTTTPPATPAAGAPAAADAAPGVVTLPSGLQYEDIVVGGGAEAKSGSRVWVHYTGTLTDGREFDSSRNGGQPYDFVIGSGTVIAGWEQGIKGMKVGGRRKLTIPPSLGYGERGFPGAIPPNATLLFDVELMDVR